MKKIINKTAIVFDPKLEQISTVVSIRAINDDFSHSNGFQVTFYGECFALGNSVEIVNLYKKNEKQYVDELVSTVIPGSSWLITGEHHIDMKYDHITLFAYSYQAVTLSLEKTHSNSGKNHFIILPYTDSKMLNKNIDIETKDIDPSKNHKKSKADKL